MNKIEIICKDLSKSFSYKTVFKNLSFKISTKESLSITGRNGSGKSTLIKIISNLLQESKGKISLKENDSELPKEKWFLKIGLLASYLNLYDELSGFENLDFFYKLKLVSSNLNNNNSKEKLNSLLEIVNLYDKRKELVKNYSSGMKQRLKIAFAVMNEPEILLMDEPRTNLDKFGVDIINKIAEEQKEKGILIIATNDEDDKLHCDDSLNIEDYK